MSLGNETLKFFEREAPFLAPDVLLWNDQVDAEGFTRALSREHPQGLIELLRLHAGCSQHTKATGSGHGKNYGRAMTECKNGSIDSIDITKGIVHSEPPGNEPFER